ncbi:hypothetical protein [Oceanicola sp. 502str15]|uniref:hypothetical protein n=1 Tax=Oceanicola sp. 502str15 TaxID=2696061 RepID=UPI0020949AE6|nr:hypothetical protein [Oceanicola sp. 502str15]MCO6382492.1 hypothetical protein [Oceanicola sp. 502str15]
MPPETAADAAPSLAHVEALLGHPEIAPHLAGLRRLRVAVTPEAGPVSGHGRAGGLELVVTGPVDAETAAEAFHVTRVIPRPEGRLRMDFSYPPEDLGGRAEFAASGRIEDFELWGG